MKKEILSEINRNREIMGLKKLVTEANLIGRPTDWADFLETYKGELFDNVEIVQPNLIGGYDFESWAWDLYKALKQKYSTEQVRKIDDDWRYMGWMLKPDMLSSDDGVEEDIRLVKGKKGGLVVVDDGRMWNPSKWVANVNEFNFKNFGTRQIVGWSYNTGESETERNIEAVTNELWQFSTSTLKKTYESRTEGGQGATPASEGEAIPGGSAFETMEVIPNPAKIKQIIQQIQNSASEGNKVTNVMINGVASDAPIGDVVKWRSNVGNKYASFSDEEITTNKTGKFTEPTTGNQVLAYLRAQNLGKALEDVGITVDTYTYSVGGDEMRADVRITTQVPAKKGTPGMTSGVETGESTDMAGQGKIISMIVDVPGDKPDWKSERWGKKKRQIKADMEDIITALG